MDSNEHDQAIIQALQQAGNQQQAIQIVLPAANAGDPRAQGLAAFWMMQTGRQPEALDYAERATDGELIFIGWWVAQQLVNNPDPNLRQRAAALFTRTMGYPAGPDPLSMAIQATQQGGADVAIQILNAAVGAPAPWRQQLETAVNKAEGQLATIASVQSEVSAKHDETLAALAEMQSAAATELAAVQRLGAEVGDIAHDRAADYLKRGYEQEADRVQRRADVLTFVSVVLAVGIAIAALVIATRLPSKGTFQHGLERAAFSLPFLALNAYLGRLASVYREEALRWRHIKLQIQTANPFLGALDEAQRKETLALLATRFFPGQPMPLPNKAAEPSDVSAALASMFAPESSRTRVTVEPEPPTPGLG